MKAEFLASGEGASRGDGGSAAFSKEHRETYGGSVGESAGGAHITEQERCWVCLRSRPRREALAAQQLKRIGEWDVFAPRITYQRPTRFGMKRFVEALFPGYLFIKLHLGTELRLAASTYGVTGVVRFGGVVARVPERAVMELRAIYREQEQKPLYLETNPQPGSAMVIGEGPLRGFRCVVLRYMPARERVAVLVEVLGREHEAELPPQALVAQDLKISGLKKKLGMLKSQTTQLIGVS